MQAAEILVNAFEFDASTPDDMDGAVEHYLVWFAQAQTAEKNSSLQLLLRLLDLPDLLRASHIANLIGYLIEQGAPAKDISAAITRKLQTTAEAALPIWETFEPKLAEIEADESADPYEHFDQHFTECEKSQPAAAQAWIALDKLYLLGISLYSKSAQARQAAAESLNCLQTYAEFSEGAHWLSKMLRVQDKQPMVVIDLDKKTGIQLTHSGIADNFQLVTLLANELGYELDPAWLAVANGNALPDDNTVSLEIDMLNGSYIAGEEVDIEHRIWGEGAPVDIPTIEKDGVVWQIVLVQQASYSRSWNNSRSFMHLQPKVNVTKRLDGNEVSQWLGYLAEG